MRDKLIYIIGGLALFVFFVVWRFPYSNLQGYISDEVYKNTRINLISESISPALFGWPGISFIKVDATVPVASSTLKVQADYLTARVGLAGIFPFGPSVSAYARGLKGGGDLYVKFKDRKTSYQVSLDAAAVELVQFAENPEAGMQGTLYSDLYFDYNTLELSKSNGDIEINIKDFKTPPQNIPGYLSTPELNLGQLSAKIVVDKGIAKFLDWRFGGEKADLQGAITGEIKLGKTYQDSIINIALKIKASEGFATNSESKPLLSYLSAYKCRDEANAFGLKWNKPIGEMMRNTFSAFPEKNPC